ncbi:START domain-containing protein [Ditylenchus destructor]|uniref:START domain-containing protein n=1 Tax=Ditylenchus destructor TaxID=166010 RepID=A0AAD4NK10_9BILA|nr:START domain-containing protein [Ditylenchus destructor]
MSPTIEQSATVLDSLSVLKLHGHTTRTDDEYEKLGVMAAEEVRRLCSNLSLWHPHSNHNGIEMFERKADLPYDTENMLLLIVTLPCTMEKLEALLSPWREYRQQWDNMLERADVIESWPEKELYLVHHLVKKMFPISARDTVDIAKVMRRTDEVTYGMTSVAHASCPPGKSHVRTHAYLGGYVLRPDDNNPNHTKFHMLFHADLNLPGPKLISNVAAKFKPKFMIQKIDNLKAGIKKFDI